MWLGKEGVDRGQQLPCQANYARYTVGTFRKIPARVSPGGGDQVTDIPMICSSLVAHLQLPFPQERTIYLFMSTHALPSGSQFLHTSLLIIAKKFQ